MIRKRKNKQDTDPVNGDQVNPSEVEISADDDTQEEQDIGKKVDKEVAQDPEAELAELRDRLQRTTAEFMNFRKQSEKRQKDARLFIRRDVFGQILPIVDNFAAAMSALDQGQDAANVLIGVKMIQEMLEKLLTDNGIKHIEAVDQPFDPRLHEAVSREEREDVAPNTNLKEIARGYTMGDLVLRHARVAVSTPPESGADADESPSDENDEDQGS